MGALDYHDFLDFDPGAAEEEPVVFDARLVHETPKAWLLSSSLGQVWVPKSHIVTSFMDVDAVRREGFGTIAVTHWIAERKGLYEWQRSARLV